MKHFSLILIAAVYFAYLTLGERLVDFARFSLGILLNMFVVFVLSVSDMKDEALLSEFTKIFQNLQKLRLMNDGLLFSEFK